MRNSNEIIKIILQKHYFIKNNDINEVIVFAKTLDFDNFTNNVDEIYKRKIKERFIKENISLDILKE